MGRNEKNLSKPTPNYIYGRNPVSDSLENNKVTKLILQRGFNDSKILSIIEKKQIKAEYVEIEKLNELARGGNHQGIIAEIKPFEYASLDEVIKISKNRGLPLVLILDEVEDPHNLGAILRSADAFDVDAVIIKNRNQVPLNMTVAKVSTGAINHVKVVMVSNLNNAISKLKENGFWIYAAEGNAKEDYQNVKFDRPTALIVGSEGRGISKLLINESDFTIRIPMYGHVNSLNVSVSVGILLSRIRNK
mgnify:CR=1 FL=1